MDDGLVLNLATDDQVPSKAGGPKKGGRWTDRLKAKRSVKRKARPEENAAAHRADDIPDRRPVKRARQEPRPAQSAASQSGERAAPSARPPTQIISSLFSYNPKIDKPIPSAFATSLSRPSNAPLDTSTFTGLGLDPLVVSHLETKLNISKPTSIQRAALPILLSSASEDTSSRDVFIQSQTGSGKTLSFLLPILQDLLPLSSLSYIDRSIGTLAIIIAPTRELAKQISDVLEAVLKLRLRPEGETLEEYESAPRLTRWLVSGLLTGGSTRAHEKARLRKGVPILVSTPGRLLDHLQNTSSFNVGKCRWLVLDEADRLMELGFEETIQGILKGLDGRRKLAIQAVEDGKSMEVGGWDWGRRLRTILCSATIREDVQKLAGTTLQNPIVIKATQDVPVDGAADVQSNSDGLAAAANNQKFTPPSQLAQKFVIVPLKLRLVTLVALLRSLLAQSQGKRGTKIIVFLSCTDSVDFHWHLLGGMSMGDEPDASSSHDSDNESGTEVSDAEIPGVENKAPRAQGGSKANPHEKVEVKSPLLPETSIFRLHGSLPLQTRLASLRGFSAVPSPKTPNAPASAILLCTSVASRGLDLPLVRAVIQYDLPTEGGATEYVHRVGRTARVGKGGEAWSIIAPSEKDWVKWVEEKMQGGDTQKSDASIKSEEGKVVALQGIAMESVLRNGFGGKHVEYEERATEVQLSLERWVLRDKQHVELARKAFQSHMRAYATHPSDEKHIFHIRHLHLGHLAKAFALREAPSAVTGANNKSKSKSQAKRSAHQKPAVKGRAKGLATEDADGDYNVADAEKRMERVVREQGRLTKQSGKMVRSGTSEFQIAGGYDLERLVGSRT
ncbi:DEAD-domain-containing protein [Obba rivulosa]|uniref:ATP-dependent RNA helicase n=1 Tax=Obba rivulosa TaxID=1052685 RepID=A0A8E2AWP0_9APHY|nr:DEAD-domain-containing protein [Obba rivulosa]